MRASRRVRNIASSILVAVALLTVGVVVAGAVFSGRQLILRFLITVVVAALGFYIISDLRLQKTQVLVASPSPSSQSTNTTGSAPAMPIVQPKSDHDVVPAPPANSTAAYMARASSSGQETPTATYAADTTTKPTPTSAADSQTQSDRDVAAASTYSAMGRIRGRKRSQPIKADESDMTQKGATPALEAKPDSKTVSGETHIVEPTPPPATDVPVADDAETTANASPLTALDTPRSMSAQIHRRDGFDQTSVLRIEDLTSDDDTVDASTESTNGQTLDEDSDFPAVDEQLESPVSASDEITLPPVSSSEEHRDPLVELVDIESADATPESNILESEQLDETSATSESLDTFDAARPLVPTEPEASVETTNGRRRYSAEELKQSGLTPTPINQSEAKKHLLGSNKVVESAPKQTINSAPKSPLSAINDAIFEGEQKIIKSLIDRGVLSSEGPITDEDVTTMVYVAFTSSELRKLLASGGSVDRDSESPELDDIEIYTSSDLANADQFLVAGPESAIDVLEAKATL